MAMRPSRPPPGADAARQLELFDGTLAEPGARDELPVARTGPRRSNANLAVPIESVERSERAERPRGGDDRRPPALVPAARGPCAGDLLPALSPPAQVPPLGQPTRRRPRPIRRPRAAAEAAAGARLANPRRVLTPTRRRGP